MTTLRREPWQRWSPRSVRLLQVADALDELVLGASMQPPVEVT